MLDESAAPTLPEDEPTPFEPVAEVRTFPPPRTGIDPDPEHGWVRRLLPIVTSRPGLVALAAVTAVLGMLATVATPAVVQATIDLGIDERSEPLARFIVLLLVLALARALLAFAYRYLLFRLGLHVEADLRSIMFDHLTRMPFTFFDRVQSGQMISRANSDIRSVQMWLAFAPLMGIAVLTFAFALVYMLATDVILTLIAVATLPGVYLLGKRLRDVVFPLSWVTQSRMAEIATLVDENVNGVRVVKSFAGEERQVRNLAAAARRLQWSVVRAADARGRYAPVLENLPRISLALVLGYGGAQVIDGELTIGTLVAFNTYILLLQTPFRLLGFFLIMTERAKASAARIFEILDEPPTLIDRPGAIDLPPPSGAITFEGVHFSYASGPPVLDGFDLEVAPGETVALVGRTGCGKTTVTRLLARFYEVDRGSVRVDGHDVRDVTLASLRARVGLVMDEPFLFSDTIHDNIAYGAPTASRAEVQHAARAAQADSFIGELAEGYDAEVGERGFTLSGGQRQRIAIARPLVVNPPILVLDDATSAIDVHVEEAIHDALTHHLAGRTTLVIAHRLSTIALADRVVLIEAGRAVASGTHAELMATEPRYAEVLAHADDDDEAGPTDETPV